MFWEFCSSNPEGSLFFSFMKVSFLSFFFRVRLSVRLSVRVRVRVRVRVGWIGKLRSRGYY